MKMTFALCLFILTTGLIKAQTNYLDKGKQYSLVRIYSKHDGVLKAKNLEIANDSIVSFARVGSNSIENMKVTNVNFVSVKEGTHAIKYGLYSAGIGFLIVGSSVLLAISDPNYVDSGENVAGIIVVSTLGFAAVGAIIGSFSGNWKRHYIRSHLTAYRYSITPNLNNKSFGINLACKF
jgi:hypothetical protein